MSDKSQPPYYVRWQDLQAEVERLRAEINLLKEDRIKVVAVQRETIIEYKACIEAALALHKSDEHGFCEVCYGASNWERHPCLTVKALKGKK